MWFIFPQFACLGRSEMAQRFDVSSFEEAAAYPLFSCQPWVSLGGNAQTARFSQCCASPISQRHLARFRNNLSGAVVPNEAVKWLSSFFVHDRSNLDRWRK
jgi:hypothetical protein